MQAVQCNCLVSILLCDQKWSSTAWKALIHRQTVKGLGTTHCCYQCCDQSYQPHYIRRCRLAWKLCWSLAISFFQFPFHTLRSAVCGLWLLKGEKLISLLYSEQRKRVFCFACFNFLTFVKLHFSSHFP